jgi:hypothetical protein
MSKAMLDKERVLTWGPATVLCRVGELENPPPTADLSAKNSARQMRAVMAYMWACMERPHPWDSPEALAAWFDANPDALQPAVMALLGAVGEGLGQKKAVAATSARLPISSSG